MSVRVDTLVAVPGRASRRRREALTGIGLLLPSVALVVAFTIFPVGYNVWLGFYAKHSLRATSAWVGLGNYTQILTDPDFWRSVWLATVYAVASTALQIVVGVAGALILHRRFTGCDFLRGVALFPYMIPTVIAVFVWRWLMNDLYGVIPYVLGTLHIPGMPEAWLTHATIMWVLIVLSVWTFFPFVLVNVLARPRTIHLSGGGMGAPPGAVRVLRVSPLLDGGLLAQGQSRAARVAADVLAARVGAARVPQALLRDELLDLLPEHGDRLRAHDRHRPRGRRHRRLQPHPVCVPGADVRGAPHAAGLHVPADHHAGAALPAGPTARAGQLDPGARADRHLVLAAVRAVDPARVLPVDPAGAGARRADRRRQPRPGARLRRHAAGAARHHRHRDLHVHRRLERLPLRAGADRPGRAEDAGHRHQRILPHGRRRLGAHHGRRRHGHDSRARLLHRRSALSDRRLGRRRPQGLGGSAPVPGPEGLDQSTRITIPSRATRRCRVPFAGVVDRQLREPRQYRSRARGRGNRKRDGPS